jgi:pimeloyl-ACP methyl ester carboxylesterase
MDPIANDRWTWSDGPGTLGPGMQTRFEGGPMAARHWQLRHRFASSGGQVAYDVIGQGPPVVLVHGTPSWSYLWRGVVDRMSAQFTVHVHDLLGYGSSEQLPGQDVAIPAQGEVLLELLEHWGLDEPCVVGHDIGGAIVLRLAVNGRRFRRAALCDAVAIAPWITPFSRHVQRYLPAFETVPEHIHRHMISAHLQTAIARPMSAADLQPYLDPWLGDTGQRAYYRQVAQFDETHTTEMEDRYRHLDIPTLVLWGERDAWLDVAVGERLAATIPNARLSVVAEAGHFLPEDRPEAVASLLADFFTPDRHATP